MSTFSSNPQVISADQFNMTTLLADMGFNESSFVPMAYAGSAAWKDGGRIVMGNRPHGDNLPSTWTAAYNSVTYPTEYAYCTSNYWNGINGWFVTFPGSTNTTTNAGIKFRNAEVYVKYAGSANWERVTPENKRLLRAVAYYQLSDFTDLGVTAVPVFSDGNLPVFSHVAVAGDRAAASADTAKYRAMHTALTEYTEIDGVNVDAVMFTVEAALISVDGAAFNGVTSIGFHAGIDYLPLHTDTVGTGKLIGATYKPAACNSRFIVLNTADQWRRVYASSYLHANTATTVTPAQTNVAADFTGNPIARQY